MRWHFWMRNNRDCNTINYDFLFYYQKSMEKTLNFAETVFDR